VWSFSVFAEVPEAAPPGEMGGGSDQTAQKGSPRDGGQPSNMPGWKRLLDGQTYNINKAEKNPWKGRSDPAGRALGFVFDEYWVPRAEITREILAGITTGLSGDPCAPLSDT